MVLLNIISFTIFLLLIALILKLNFIISKLKNMPTKQEFEAAFAEANEATNNIAADIEALTEKLATSGLTDAEEADVLTQLKAHAEALKAVASKTPDGTPTPPVG